MDHNEAKELAARAALALLPERGVIGLGSGSTAKLFIDAVGDSSETDESSSVSRPATRAARKPWRSGFRCSVTRALGASTCASTAPTR